MNDKQPSQGAQKPPAAADVQPAPRAPRPPDRWLQAFWGGLLAGSAIAIALAVVMRVIQQASPNGFSIRGSVLVVLFLGLVIGGGLGLGLAAAVPDRTADSAAPRHATPADQPPAPANGN
jgi:hypothetical protein